MIGIWAFDARKEGKDERGDPLTWFSFVSRFHALEQGMEIGNKEKRRRE